MAERLAGATIASDPSVASTPAESPAPAAQTGSQLRRWRERLAPQPRWVADELLRTTTRRLVYVGALAVPLHLVHVVAFALAEPGTGDAERWRIGIIASHAVLLVAMGGIAAAATWLRARPERLTAARALRTATVALALSAAIVIVAIDQWVTPNVTPFLVVCAVIGLIVLMRPWQAALWYAAGYTAYAWAIGLTQTDESVLLSNRVNGITAVAIGLCLSLIMWHSEARNLRQQRRIEEQQAELEERNVELSRLAARDGLTGLYNRREFHLLFDKELARLRRDEQTAALLLLDLDDFKPVNDRYGHPVGDELLVGLARRLRRRLREADILARWGGEEFLALLPGADLVAANKVGEDLADAVRRDAFRTSVGGLNVTASVGVAEVGVEDDAPWESAYSRVDRALYEAKAAGKDHVRVAPHS